MSSCSLAGDLPNSAQEKRVAASMAISRSGNWIFPTPANSSRRMALSLSSSGAALSFGTTNRSFSIRISPLDTAASMAFRAVVSSRSEEHTSELQSLMRISYAVFGLTKKNKQNTNKKIKPELQIHDHSYI